MKIGNHTKRHEELREFGIRMLTYMGITRIENEETILLDNKRYRIDIIGYRNPNSYYDDKKNIVMVEIGNNQYDKINHLRSLGYLVFVIPYSEKEEEFQDNRRLMQIMIDGNQDLSNKIIEMVLRWRNIADKSLKDINEYELKVNQLIIKIDDSSREIDRIQNFIKKMISALKSFD